LKISSEKQIVVEAEAVRHEREVSSAGGKKLDSAERDKCKPVLLRLSMAGILDTTTTTYVRMEGTWLWTLVA
jgi:hypothetical protein